MQTRARRRLDMGLLAGGVVLAGLGGLLGGLPAHAEEIDAIWTSAEVRDDGSAHVVEVIDYDFGISTDHHGIFRDIPGVSPDTFRVTTDAPDNVQVESAGTATRFRIGDPDRTVSGKHRYRIEYDLPGVVRNGVLDWETFGNQWEVTTQDVEVHVVAPFEIDAPQCLTGPPGGGSPCDITTPEPGHVRAHVDEVPAGDGVSIEGRQGAALTATPTLPEPPSSPPPDDGTGLGPPALAAAGGAALAAFPMSRLVRRAGREVISSGGAADVAYAGQGVAPASYAQWPTRAGPYEAQPPGSAPRPPLPPPPGADDRPPPPPPPAPAGGDDRPPPPSPPPPTDAPPGRGIARPLTAFGGVFGTRHESHPQVAPPPAVGRIGEPIAGPPPWLPAAELRIDEAELAQMATIEFAPPAELTPAQGGIVLEESVKPNHKAAWLVQAAIDGDVHIEESGQKATGLARTGPGNAETSTFLDAAFAGRQHVSLLKYDKQFANAWTALSGQLSRWQRGSGLWDPKADSRLITWRVLGVLAFIVGVLMVLGGAFAANLAGPGWLPLVLVGGLVGGGALATVVRSWELRVRTAAGSGLWLRVESFRRFLAESEAYHAEEAARRGVLREYTAWALALGEIDRWRMAVMTATTIPPDTPGLGYVWLGASIISSTSTASTAPSSSGGGGGFGGGSIGGGAGGGGGGSW